METFWCSNIDETGDIEPQEGYGCPKTVGTEENIEAVQEIIPSQAGQYGTKITCFYVVLLDFESYLAQLQCFLPFQRSLVIHIPLVAQ